MVLSSYLAASGCRPGTPTEGYACSCRGPGAAVVAHQVSIEDAVHLLDGFEPGVAVFDMKLLIEQRTAQQA